jgi:general secretion pathway protein D
MNLRHRVHAHLTPTLLAVTVGVILAGCAGVPTPKVRRDADPGALKAPSTTAGGSTTTTGPGGVQTQTLPADKGDARPQIRRGTGQVINRGAASSPPPNLGGSTGEATFNFEGESLHAVVKAILGDMLGQNYVIAPGVQGTVTLATPKPVSPADALSLLEMVLGWNNARLVYSGGRYNIVAADQALVGTVAPRTGPASNARGFEVRTVPLRYVSATEMEKILKPYARPNAIVGTDNARNVITVGGSKAELENYLRTIEIFDVDWLAGMSVGRVPSAVGQGQYRRGRPGESVRRAEQVAGGRHVPFHAARRRQRGAGDHAAGQLPRQHPAVAGTASTVPAAPCSCFRTNSSTSRRANWPSACPTCSAAVAAVAMAEPPPRLR